MRYFNPGGTSTLDLNQVNRIEPISRSPFICTLDSSIYSALLAHFRFGMPVIITWL